MRRTGLLIGVVWSLAAASANATGPSLIPLPSGVVPGPGAFSLDENPPLTKFEWDLRKYISGPGKCRVMFHCDSWFHAVEVKENGPPTECLLRAELRKAGKDKRCTFEARSRKEER